LGRSSAIILVGIKYAALRLRTARFVIDGDVTAQRPDRFGPLTPLVCGQLGTGGSMQAAATGETPASHKTKCN
jgi:hypothetical protein